MVEVLTEEPVIDDGMGIARPVRTARKPRGLDMDDSMATGQKILPERIRIHSASLGAILAGMVGTNTADFGEDVKSFVLVRPFKCLFYCSGDLRSLIKKLEEKFSRSENPSIEEEVAAADNDRSTGEQQSPGDQPDESPAGGVNAAQTSHMASITQPHEPDDGLSDAEGKDSEAVGEEAHDDDLHHSELDLKHLKVLAEFIDTEIETKRAHLLTPACRKVFFADLWYLFRPGQEVIARDGKQAYRVISVTSPHHRRARPWDAWLMFNSHQQETEKKKKQSPFSITCAYIDFDGSYIGPVSETFDFKKFDGQTKITSLPVYPIRLHPSKQSDVSDIEWAQLELLAPEDRCRQHLVQRGAKFLSVVGIKPMYYAGPTIGAREEIESQVIIDFETAFSVEDGKEKMTPPEHQSLVEKRSSGEEEEEDSIVNQACNADCCRHDWIYNDKSVDDKERTRYVNSLLPDSDGSNRQPSIAVIPQPLKELRDSKTKTGCSITDDELAIMSCRVFGFVLRQRRWGECVCQPQLDHIIG